MHPHFDDALTSFLAGAPGLAGQGTEALPNEARDAVRQAVRDAIRGAREGANQAVTVQSTAPQATIDALRGQIEAEKTAIDKLTAQLTGTTSNAAERAITSQIEQSQERLTSLQSQLDHALGVSEGQRFTNKVIGELRALPAPNPLEQWPRQEGKEALPAKRQGDA